MRPAFLHLIAIPVLTVPFAITILLAKRLQQRLNVISALRDPRRPILLLRSFSLENPWLNGESDPLRSTLAGRFFGSYLEESIRQPLVDVGPLVAIGNPRKRDLQVGAIRFYSGSESWTSVVSTLVRQSQLILLQISPQLNPGPIVGKGTYAARLPDSLAYQLSDGFLTELRILRKEQCLEKTCLILIDQDGAILAQENFQSMLNQMPPEFHRFYTADDWPYRVVAPSGPNSILRLGLDEDRTRSDTKHVSDALYNLISALRTERSKRRAERRLT